MCCTTPGSWLYASSIRKLLSRDRRIAWHVLRRERAHQEPGREERARHAQAGPDHASHARNVPIRSQALRPMMTAATTHAAPASSGELTNSPIFFR